MFPGNKFGSVAAFPDVGKVPAAPVGSGGGGSVGTKFGVDPATGAVVSKAPSGGGGGGGGGGGPVMVNMPKTPVTEGSKGIKAAVMPNVCKMPGPPAPFVPTPLPNIGKSENSPSGYTEKVLVQGKKVAIQGATFKSMGDIPSQGTGGGLISATVQDLTEFVGPGSVTVKMEGKAVQLLGDVMSNNKKNAM